jgi:hypothetical protein
MAVTVPGNCAGACAEAATVATNAKAALSAAARRAIGENWILILLVIVEFSVGVDHRLGFKRVLLIG